METTNYKGMTILIPDDNKYLTQSKEVDIEDRIYSKKLYLAINDSVDNWKEITEEEYNKTLIDTNK